MKIAFCLYGLSGNYSEGLGHDNYVKGAGTTLQIMIDSYESYKKNFFDINNDCNIDVYFHTRKHENIDKIIEMYKPKKYLIDDKLTTCPNNHHIFMYSKLDSQLKVLSLVEKKYDIVFLCRFDLTFLKPLIIKEENITKNVICFPDSYWKMYENTILQHKYFFNIPKEVENNIKIKYNDIKNYANDWLFIFSYEDIKEIIKMIETHISVGTKSNNPVIWPPQYFNKNNFKLIYSNLSFYDTPLTRIKYGIYT
jgi:hypothetical protein